MHERGAVRRATSRTRGKNERRIGPFGSSGQRTSEVIFGPTLIGALSQPTAPGSLSLSLSVFKLDGQLPREKKHGRRLVDRVEELRDCARHARRLHAQDGGDGGRRERGRPRDDARVLGGGCDVSLAQR